MVTKALFYKKSSTKEFFQEFKNHFIFDDKDEFYYNISNNIYKAPDDYKLFWSLYDGSNLNVKFEERNNNQTYTKEKIQKIINYNSFGNYFNIDTYCSGLWVYPSFINHSCLPNADLIIIGDVMIIYANKNINKNDEIFISYIYDAADYNTRKESLKNNWNFFCSCDLCRIEGNENNEIIKNYNEMYRKIFYLSMEKEISKEQFKHIENFGEFIENNKKELCLFQIGIGYLNFGNAYNFINIDKSIYYTEKSLKYLKGNYLNASLKALNNLCKYYIIKNNGKMFNFCFKEIEKLYEDTFKNNCLCLYDFFINNLNKYITNNNNN